MLQTLQTYFFRKTTGIALVIGVIISVCIGLLAAMPSSPTESLRLKLTDYFYLGALQRVEPRDDIIIVAIDDRTLTDPRFGRWQDWRRTYFADVLNALSKEQPATIGIDVAFSEPSRERADDIALAEAIQSAGNVVLVGRSEEDGTALFPIDDFAGAAGLGFANLDVDVDNVVRRSPLVLNFGTETQPLGIESFALAIARLVAPAESYVDIPVDTRQRMYINFFGKPAAYQTVSFADAVDGNFDSVQIKDAIVLIGATPADLRDVDAVPVSFGTRMPGVEIHANAVQTILDGSFLREPSSYFRLLLFFVFSIGGTLLFIRRGVLFSLGIMFYGMIAYVLIAQQSFHSSIIIDVFHPLLALLFAFIGTYLYRFVFADKEKRHLKTAFGHYVSGDLVERITQNPAALQLGGEKKELTIFFSDIANFTSISEQLTPEELVTLLNEYLGTMTDIIMASGGTLDKYIGDAVMAFWGAPLPQPDHAKAACLAALAQRDALNIMKEKVQLPKNMPLHARMGIHTGEVVVGNMGSNTRFNYTVMGDAVNLASRLEGVNKSYGTQIMISEATFLAARDIIEAREIDTIRVKGKQDGVKIYELLARTGELSLKQQRANEQFAVGLAAYRSQNWQAAISAFEGVQKIAPQDGPSETFLKRIADYKRQPPAIDWDGIYTMNTK